MKKFKFKFESVEKVRKSREEEALRHLGSAQTNLANAQAFRNNLVDQLNQSLLRREELARTQAAILQYQLENDFISGSRVRILHAENTIKKARKAVERALQHYLNQRRQTKTIEMLREKHLTEYKKEKNRYEQKVQDDLYVMRSQLNTNSDDDAPEMTAEELARQLEQLGVKSA